MQKKHILIALITGICGLMGAIDETQRPEQAQLAQVQDLRQKKTESLHSSWKKRTFPKINRKFKFDGKDAEIKIPEGSDFGIIGIQKYRFGFRKSQLDDLEKGKEVVISDNFKDFLTIRLVGDTLEEVSTEINKEFKLLSGEKIVLRIAKDEYSQKINILGIIFDINRSHLYRAEKEENICIKSWINKKQIVLCGEQIVLEDIPESKEQITKETIRINPWSSSDRVQLSIFSHNCFRFL